MARNNGTGQGLLGQQMQDALNGIGVFEVNFKSGGVTGRIGTGGIDIGGALYSMAKRGIDYINLQDFIRRDKVNGEIAYQSIHQNKRIWTSKAE